jgi:hypothetical protein
MAEVKYEIRVVKVTRPVVGQMTQEIIYLAKPTTAPDPGALIAASNPTLVLPLPPPITLEGQATAAEISAAAALTD